MSATDSYTFAKCSICGYESGNIGKHIKSEHNISSKEYKKIYKSEVTSQKYRDDKSSNKNVLELKIIVEESKQKYKNYNPDSVVECKECGYLGKDISTHIIRYHNTTTSQYKIKHNSHVKSKDLLDKVKGDNNPWANHGGRYSPFSKNNIIGVDHLETQNKAAESRIRNLSYNTMLEYYLNRGYSKSESQLLLRERQSTFSLTGCIEKYGESEGTSRWVDRQIRWRNTMDSKPAEERSEIERKRLIKSSKSSQTSSKAEMFISRYLEELGYDVESQFSILYGNSSVLFCDIKIQNVIIEYHGDYWHMNPEIYAHDDIFNHGTRRFLASECWDEQINRKEFIEDQGYKYYIIWESDFKKNPRKTLELCVNYLKKQIENS